MRIELHYTHDETGRPHGTIRVGGEAHQFVGLMQLLRLLDEAADGGRAAAIRNHPSGRYRASEAS